MSGGYMGQPGTVSITNQTDAAILRSGQPVRVFDIQAISDGTATTVKLYNGTSASGTQYLQIDGVVSKAATFNSSQGVLFPGGCFADVDSHTVALTIVCALEC